MTATAAQIARLRRMVAESTTATYSDVTLQGYIERYPVADADGYEPFVVGSTGAYIVNTLWTATYDLNAAAAEVWEEKAASVADKYDLNADGSSHALSQKQTQALAMAKLYRSKRIVSTQVRTTLGAPDYSWWGNSAERD